MSVVTRFAPSPTGFLHIGSARTALFNYLYAKATGGTYRLRIEDTDHKRSTDEAKQAILDGLAWLGIAHDGEVVYQSARGQAHKDAAKRLVDEGKAYYCYTSQEELDDLRNQAKEEKRFFAFKSPWRDSKKTRDDVPPVVRLKAPLDGEIVIQDQVQGEIKVNCSELDDMVLLRSDGTPTYMLAVVVDDHDMGITHVVRGDDHLTNSFRQVLLYQALGYDIPVFAHIPLIHGDDGAKLSKRHGALGVESYRDMGILADALCNYLLRLGWSHGDDEIISAEEAKSWFNLESIGKSPSRFDMNKLLSLNSHYLKQTANEQLVESVGYNSEQEKHMLMQLMDALKDRAKTLEDITIMAASILHAPTTYTEKAQKNLQSEHQAALSALIMALRDMPSWELEDIESLCKAFAEDHGLKLGQVMGMVRTSLTGSHASPSMFLVLHVLGKDESIARLEQALQRL